LQICRTPKINRLCRTFATGPRPNIGSIRLTGRD
jgi:hypothetical protein